MSPLPVLPLDPLAYAPYGEVVSPRHDQSTRPANLGTAIRHLDVAALRDLRPGSARPHLSIYCCAPPPGAPTVRLLERHAHSTQLFVPLGDGARYLAVVARGAERPDLATLRIFEVTGCTGITYHPGTWHHPLIVLDRPTDFLCLVWEDGTAGDCEEVAIAPALEVGVTPRPTSPPAP
jgi:ureidoglycolate lyase